MTETLFTSSGAIHNLMEAGLEIQGLEAKLQHYQQLEARVNDLYARMLQRKERLFEEECNHPSSPPDEEFLWVEAWLEALEWVWGDRADPLMEGLTQPLP